MGKAGNNPYCIHRAIEHENQGVRERLVRVAPPEGKPFDHGRFEIIVEEWPPEKMVDVEQAPTLLGHDLQQLLTRSWRDHSVWTKEQRRDILKRLPRLFMPV